MKYTSQWTNVDINKNLELSPLHARVMSFDSLCIQDLKMHIIIFKNSYLTIELYLYVLSIASRHGGFLFLLTCLTIRNDKGA